MLAATESWPGVVKLVAILAFVAFLFWMWER